MVRLDRGSRWLPPSAFPQPGTIGRLVRDREFLPGPAQYEGAHPPLGSDIKGGVINKGPRRPPTKQMGPGPGEYVTTEAIEVRLPGLWRFRLAAALVHGGLCSSPPSHLGHCAGYIPLHMRGAKPQAIKMAPPATGKVLVDYGRVQGRSSIHLMSVKNPHKATSWDVLAR
jgi:hypothetical protein